MPGMNYRVTECAFPRQARARNASRTRRNSGRVVNVVVGFVSFEPGGELVGVIEDFLRGAGHSGHLRYFGRAGMA